jgi:hypothetical protein
MTTTTETTNETASPPIIKLKIGLIYANIWQRDIDDEPYYSVTFERRYRDAKSGDWHSSRSFNADDLLALAKLADQAHTEIMKLRAN